VLEVAVVGAPHADRGMIVQAYVVLREGTAASQDKAAELQDFAKQSIAPYKYPRVVEFVAELPKTISGKTQRYRLRQLAEENLRSSPR
jgi:2-aminobenzoate-CoA ligase